MQDQNTQGIVYMVLSMACYAISDLFVKLAADYFSFGQLAFLLGIGSSAYFYAVARYYNITVFTKKALEPAVLFRTFGEVFAAVFIIMAFACGSLSGASAILQIVPIMVALAASLFLHEKLGVHRLLAIVGGFVGTLVIIQPHPDHFDLASAFALIAALGMAMRDLGSRIAGRRHSATLLALYGALATIIVGFLIIIIELLLASSPQSALKWVSLEHWLYVTGMTVFGTAAVFTLTHATRISALSAVSPYRYTRLPFALLLGVVLLDETVTPSVLYGSLIVVAAGLYLLYKEAKST